MQLHDIFDFFIKQLCHLSQPTSPYFSNSFYLLESLSTIKTVVLLADIGAEDLIGGFFKMFFGMITLEMSKNVYLCMLDILVALVEEVATFPRNALDILLSQFKKKRQVFLYAYFID
jgi:sister-chromatid-cohesion protein PDS5